jgi:hypothetical protein
MKKSKLSTNQWLALIVLTLMLLSYFRSYAIDNYKETNNKIYLIVGVILSIVLFFVFMS